MSQKITRENGTIKDKPNLPPGMRYALYCKRAWEKEPHFECPSKENGGLIGFYGDEKTAEEAGEAHPHPVILRFYQTHQASRYDF